MGGGDSRLLDKPWREMDWGKRDKLLSDVKKYKPDGASHLRVLLYGPVGAGKSSYINSAGSLILGRSYNRADVDASVGKTGSATTVYRTHKLKNRGEKMYPVVFNDLMGLEGGKDEGVRPEDIILAMKGHVKDGYEFDQKNTLSPQDDEYYIPKPSIDDKVHVLVCMLDASASAISNSVLQKMKEVREAARRLGIPQMAIATHIDQLCGAIDEDVRKVFRSKALKERMDQFIAKVGIPANYIFPVRNNYEGRNKEAVDMLLLTAVKCILSYGDDFLVSQ